MFDGGRTQHVKPWWYDHSQGIQELARYWEKNHDLDPDRKLRLAMLTDALVIHPSEESKHWVERVGGEGLSFDRCCESLGINPAWLRPKLLAVVKWDKRPWHNGYTKMTSQQKLAYHRAKSAEQRE